MDRKKCFENWQGCLSGRAAIQRRLALRLNRKSAVQKCTAEMLTGISVNSNMLKRRFRFLLLPEHWSDLGGNLETGDVVHNTVQPYCHMVIHINHSTLYF